MRSSRIRARLVARKSTTARIDRTRDFSSGAGTGEHDDMIAIGGMDFQAHGRLHRFAA